jgi:hypothetical protein
MEAGFRFGDRHISHCCSEELLGAMAEAINIPFHPLIQRVCQK